MIVPLISCQNILYNSSYSADGSVLAMSKQRENDSYTETDLLLGNGFGSPDEDCEGIHAHHNGHRQQDGSNDLHCVVCALQDNMHPYVTSY